MPNRIIKESICRSDSIDSLTWFEEVLFYRLIVVCDDFGRFDGRPAIIKGSCFPLKDIRTDQIEKALAKLSTAGMVCRYETNGKPYLQLTAWEQHQQIRAKKSKYPEFTGECTQIEKPDNNCNQMLSIVPVIQSNPNPNRNTKNTMCKADASALFEKLWELYPEKKGKGKVSDTAKMRLLKIGYDEMVRAIKRYIAYVDSIDYLHYQNGSTFFNSGYVDYLDANYTPPKAKTPKTASQFNQFLQNDYDFEQLEREILSN